jgi:hypothetical protein
MTMRMFDVVGEDEDAGSDLGYEAPAIDRRGRLVLLVVHRRMLHRRMRSAFHRFAFR